METWDRTPLGLETAAPVQPRAALAAEGSEKRWNLQNAKVPALHREAERDTTGNFSRQPPLHTWIGRRVQGKRRNAATVRLYSPKGHLRIAERTLRFRLPWGSIAVRGPLGGRNSFGEPRK
jgi:hypothetical protein